MTTEERLDRLEHMVRSIALRLNLVLPETPEEMRALGVVGVVHDAAVRQQTIGEQLSVARIMAAQQASSEPELTPQQALERYGEGSGGIAMLFPDPIRHLDPDDHRWTLWPPGWHRVPPKHVGALQNHKGVMKVPEDI
jgi:hypothetical protein